MMIVLSIIDEKPLGNFLLARPPFLQEHPQPQDSRVIARKTQTRAFRQSGLRQVREIVLAQIGPHSQAAVGAGLEKGGES